MKKRRAILLGLASALLALCLCACSSAGDAGDSSNSAAADGKGAASDSASAPSSEGTSSSDSDEYTFGDDCTDEYDNVTLNALTELNGRQLASLLDQQEYVWNEDSCEWQREDGAGFVAYKEAGAYDLDAYNEMNEKGGAVVSFGFLQVAGYKDAQAALAGNAQCVIEDSYFEGDDGAAIFYGPSTEEYLAVISKSSENTVQFWIISQEAIGSGMLDEALGEQAGGTLQEVWTYLTGEENYGN